MGSNTSLLKNCGEVGHCLVDIHPVSSSASTKFILCQPDQQLAVLASLSSNSEYVVKFKSDETTVTGPEEIQCVASHASTTCTLPVSDVVSHDQSFISFTLSISPLLQASPGLHTVCVSIRNNLLASLAVWVESDLPVQRGVSPSTSPSPSPTSPSLQYPFQSDGPQFRTFVAHCENLLPALRQSFKYTQEKSVKVADAINYASKELAGLISCVQDLDKFSASLPHQFHKVIFALATTLNSELQTQSRLESILQHRISSPINSYISAIDLKTLSARRKQYHDQAKLFYSYMGKNLSTAESANFAKKVHFELQRFDYFVILTELLEGPQARRLIYDLSQVPHKLGSTSFDSVMNESKIYQANARFSKSQINAQRDKISSSKSFSDFSTQVSTDHRQVHKEGILWTYKGLGKSSGWHKQWVVLKGSVLSEFSDWKTQGKKLSHTPLRLTFACIRRQDSGNYNGFEIITTNGITRAFRAESKSELEQWLQNLQIAVGVEEVPDQSDKTKSVAINTISDLVFSTDKSNTTCCDCGDLNQVEWISINLLCVVCINCSAVHRSLGAHVSKIRSLRLDSFTSKEIVELMKFVSNNNVNSIYEAELPQKHLKPSSSADIRTSTITDKYLNKKFVSPLEEKEPESIHKRLNHNLIKSIHLNSIYLLQQCIAQGVSLNKVHLEHGETVFQYSLKHYEGTKADPVFFITEFLLLNGLQVGKLPRDSSTLSKCEYDYWRSKAETNGVYNPVNRRATIKNSKVTSIARIDTSVTGSTTPRTISSASDASDNNNKRWSIGGSLPLSSPLSASVAHSKNRGIKFPKIHGGKNQ
ncbi:LANO_0G00782g1_1 [Lachancea nothofagi CBS 11611]|uniref:ADP-ribosylation factor GTPase-activating protein n=1 Tax=Lachancea nothofagi CBS 11611 TaxID=1266666 RepID=A0A1G4KES3_9SACH|nr:LANO_0G00782g1_1 [Lachancea nothofagi CBS 11611]